MRFEILMGLTLSSFEIFHMNPSFFVSQKHLTLVKDFPGKCSLRLSNPIANVKPFYKLLSEWKYSQETSLVHLHSSIFFPFFEWSLFITIMSTFISQQLHKKSGMRKSIKIYFLTFFFKEFCNRFWHCWNKFITLFDYWVNASFSVITKAIIIKISKRKIFMMMLRCLCLFMYQSNFYVNIFVLAVARMDDERAQSKSH